MSYGTSSINDDDSNNYLVTEGSGDASQDWEFAGVGTVVRIDNLLSDQEESEAEAKITINDEEYVYGKEDPAWKKLYNRFTQKNKDKKQETHKDHKLGEWTATSIAGNDITSSCLYVAGIATIAAGKFAPISLLLVCILLYLFRSVYSEVGSALPMNGGTYTVLLNTTSKAVGGLAACLTLLSYTATAVISASTATDYIINSLWSGMSDWKMECSIGILVIFAILNLIGLSESAGVALVIFIFHMSILALITGWGIVHIVLDHSLLVENLHSPPVRNVPLDIFYGFCSGLLGVTGFETSANYIEEQKDGVFPKTLRNMWIAVTIFNPLITLASFGIIPISTIVQPDVSGAVLSEMGTRLGGKTLGYIVGADATLVLMGSVLTSYVGVTGLCRRMSLDRCLPQFFIHENPITNTPWVIITMFLGITSSLYWITQGNTETLAGVYTVAFISVMSLFAVGNMLLKYKRGHIPREHRAPWPAAMIALFGVLIGMLGSIIYDPDIVKYFAIYFIVTIILVFSMFLRIRLMKIVLFFLSKTPFLDRVVGKWIRDTAKSIKNQSVIFFTKTDDLGVLNKAILYVRENELTDSLKLVHVYESDDKIPPNLVNHVTVLDHIYPKLRIDLVLVRGRFCPHVVISIAKRLGIPQNFMFIACPGNEFPEKIGEFGGVRVITH